MKKMISDKRFIAGFLIGLVLIGLLNVFLPNESNYFNRVTAQGFPFAFYQGSYEEREGGAFISEILWSGVLGDLFFALLIAGLTGLSAAFLVDREIGLR